MSAQSRLDRLSTDLHRASLNSTTLPPTISTSDSNSASHSTMKPKIKVDTLADSWEDDADTDASDNEALREGVSTTAAPEAPGPTLKSPTTRARDIEDELDGRTVPEPPPPTPISPQLLSSKVDFPTSRLPATSLSAARQPQPPNSPTRVGDGSRRPEKTTATANRLIAGALGIRAPAKTAEQRHYDRAVKEAEMKRRKREEGEREREKAEDEKAKAAVWDG